MTKWLIVLAATLSSCRTTHVEEASCLITADHATDRLRAQSACEQARARFRNLVGSPVSRVVVEVGGVDLFRINADSREVTVHWPASSRLRQQFASIPDATSNSIEANVSSYWNEALPHEIGHALLTARLGSNVLGHDGYATSLPDWLDEGIAIWMEPEVSRSRRLDQALSLSSHDLILENILAAQHPKGTNVTGAAITTTVVASNCRAAADPDFCKGRNRADTSVIRHRTVDGKSFATDTILSGTDEFNQFLAPGTFYPQSYALIKFIIDEGGAAAMSQVLDRALKNTSNTTLLRGVRGLSSDSAALTRQWEGWLERQRRAR